ncbi:hypothetical protein ACFC0M_08930 [Streptomyces sp. NPDC056149]|uniref:hypothetical protein n=1 Tax=Streptomyces sp. NPDC056149 TaxID=3345728 RepID=UPI0035D91436
MDAGLFVLLTKREAEEYRARVHAARHTRPQLAWDNKSGSSVSIHAGGSALAIRLLPGHHQTQS